MSVHHSAVEDDFSRSCSETSTMDSVVQYYYRLLDVLMIVSVLSSLKFTYVVQSLLNSGHSFI